MKTDPEYYHLLKAFLEVEVNNQIGNLDPTTFEPKIKTQESENENDTGEAMEGEKSSKLFEIEEELLPIIALIVRKIFCNPFRSLNKGI